MSASAARAANEPASCSSTVHVKGGGPVTVAGTFDASAIDGSAPGPRSYCTRCAVLLEFGGLFTPQRALVRISAADVLAGYAPEVHDAVEATETFTLLTVDPPS